MTRATAGVRTLTAVLVALVALGSPSGGAAGQGEDAPAGTEEDGRGWLGIGVRATMICPGSGERETEAVDSAECRRSLMVEAVVEGSPAEEAGVQPGDTLLALDESALSDPGGGAALRALEPGEPVSLLVGREGGRERLRVVPAPRPPEAGPVNLVTPLAPSTAGTVAVAPEIVLRWSRGLQGVEQPRELARAVSSGGLRVDAEGRVYLQGEDGELVVLRGVDASRIRTLHDSVMQEVRDQIRRLRRRAAVPDGPFSEASPPSRPGVFRAAGAEFRPLGPGLGEYFEGVDRGLLVLRVVPGTPASDLGLRAGDVVVEAAGRTTAHASDLRSAFGSLSRDDSLTVRWVRKGEAMEGTIRPR